LYYMDTADAAEFIHYVMEEKFNMIIGVPEDEMDETNLSLEVYPNPFQCSTRFDFVVPEPDFVDISIFDLQGKKVAAVLSTSMPSGPVVIDWNATGLSKGIYVARMQAGGQVVVKKLIAL